MIKKIFDYEKAIEARLSYHRKRVEQLYDIFINAKGKKERRNRLNMFDGYHEHIQSIRHLIQIQNDIRHIKEQNWSFI